MKVNVLSLSALAEQVPLLSQARFAMLVGVSTDVVRGWVSRGLLPMKKIGRRNLVNIAILNDECRRHGI